MREPKQHEEDGPRILVVGARDTSLLHADLYGVQVVLLQSVDRLTEYQRNQSATLLLCDLADSEACLRSVFVEHKRAPLRAVVAFHDTFILLAAQLAQYIGVQGNSYKAVLSTIDKARTRELVQEVPELSNPQWQLATNLSSAISAAERLGFPLVVKPRAGSGSEGVHILRNQAELVALDYLPKDTLIETFVSGLEVSVETFTKNGAHEVIAVTEKVLVGGSRPVEIGHQMPARLSLDVFNQIQTAVPALLDLVGLTVGAAHTELIIGAEKVFVVETHARYGGDRIWEMVGLTTGRYPQPGTLAAVAGYREVAVPVTAAAAAVRFLTAPRTGVFVGLSGGHVAREIPGVYSIGEEVRRGDRVSIDLTASRDRIGYVLAVGRTTEEAVYRAEQAIAVIAVDIV